MLGGCLRENIRKAASSLCRQCGEGCKGGTNSNSPEGYIRKRDRRGWKSNFSDGFLSVFFSCLLLFHHQHVNEMDIF